MWHPQNFVDDVNVAICLGNISLQNSGVYTSAFYGNNLLVFIATYVEVQEGAVIHGWHLSDLQRITRNTF